MTRARTTTLEMAFGTSQFGTNQPNLSLTTLRISRQMVATEGS